MMFSLTWKSKTASSPRKWSMPVLGIMLLWSFNITWASMLMAAPIPRVGVIGDSMSDEYPVNEHGGPPNFDRSWVEILQTLRPGDVTFNNQAIDGSKTYTAISRGQHTRIRDSVAAGELDVVVVAIGVNNIAFGSLVDLLTFNQTPESVAQRIERDLITILDTVELGGDVPIVLANIPDFRESTFARNLLNDFRTVALGGQPSAFISLILALAPDDLVGLLGDGTSLESFNLGVDNVLSAITLANERIFRLAQDRQYIHGDLFKFFNDFGTNDLEIAGSVIPRDLLYSQYDFFHPSSILGGLAGNVAMAAVGEYGLDTESLILSDQEIMNFWNGRATTQFGVSGEETYLVDPKKYLSSAVPEASSLVMLMAAMMIFLSKYALNARGQRLPTGM